MIEAFDCKLCDFYEEYPNEDSPLKCPECGSKWYTLRFIKASKPKSKFVSIGYKDTPRYSVSLGVSETQLEEAKKLHPQAEWKKFGHSWRPLIRNRTDKKLMMKQAGMEEFGTEQFKGR